MIAEAICDRLTDAGYEVLGRPETGPAAVEAALTLRPDLVLMDVRLKGDMDGIRASELIHQKMRVPVVYLTGDSDQKTLERAKVASAYGYVLKPFHIRNLIVAIEVGDRPVRDGTRWRTASSPTRPYSAAFRTA